MSHKFTHLSDIIDLDEPGDNNENIDSQEKFDNYPKNRKAILPYIL